MIYGVLLSLGLLAAFLMGRWYGRDIGYAEGREAERKSIRWGPPSGVEHRWYWEYAELGTRMIHLAGVIADQSEFIRKLKGRVDHKVLCLTHGEQNGVVRCPACQLDRESRVSVLEGSLRAVEHFGFLSELGGSEVRCFFCDALVPETDAPVEHHADCVFVAAQAALAGKAPEKEQS